MKLRCVVDANILVDLNNGNVLPLLFRLPIEATTPGPVLDEMVIPSQAALLQLGLLRAGMSLEQLQEAADQHAQEPRLSLGDWAAFIVVRDENLVLLTGDQRLRNLAQAHGVIVHGVLWVLDYLDRLGLLTGPALANSLQQMLDKGARLPKHEVAERRKRWVLGDERGITGRAAGMMSMSFFEQALNLFLEQIPHDQGIGMMRLVVGAELELPFAAAGHHLQGAGAKDNRAAVHRGDGRDF